MNYRLLADIVVAVHVGYVLAVVLGLVLVLVGWALGWKWVRNRWFRLIHLAMIAGVVARAVFWDECPLTWWERDLRELAGSGEFEGSRIGYFLHLIIHPNEVWTGIPTWTYLTVYSIFGLLVLAAFWLVPVDWRPSRRPAPVTEDDRARTDGRPADAAKPSLPAGRGG
jgi:hypothetical protein